MNQAERLGAKLTMLIRREFGQQQALAETQEKINQAYIEIQNMDASALYAHTSEIPRVSGSAEVTQIRALRPEREDGGSTYALTPIADTVTMPAVMDCPNSSAPELNRCREIAPHVHYVSGGVARLKDLGSIS